MRIRRWLGGLWPTGPFKIDESLAWISSLLVWSAFPPIGAWWLAWVAPVGWLRWISNPHPLAVRRWAIVYLVGFVYWLLLLQWLRLPHWSASFGWFVLAGYLALYLPLFIVLARTMVHRWRWPTLLAIPVAWTGLELFRSRFLTGFPLLPLGHTQVPWLAILQIADLFGAYGVSFLIMAVAACIERMIPRPERKRLLLLPLLVMGLLLGSGIGYGTSRTNALSLASTSGRTLRAALIQGSFDTQFDGDVERTRQAFLDYARLSRTAASQFPEGDLDLVIWPESMFTAAQPMITYDEPLQVIQDWPGTVEELRQRLDEYSQSVGSRASWVTQQTRTRLLAGIEWNHLRAGREIRYNSAVYFDRDGKLIGRYDKMHPVMFGEYVPLGEWFPWLYRLTPMPDGLTPGAAPQTFTVEGVRIAPMICFENTVPHLVRRQCRDLAAKGESPDVLVTITNDGWFWGSSLLDVHLACGIYRAIEMRRPMLIAANTGFSAWIDSAGRVRDRGPRRAEGIVHVRERVPDEPVRSSYFEWGDCGAGICQLACGCAALSLLFQRFYRSQRDPN